MRKAKGEAIRPSLRNGKAVKRLQQLLYQANRDGDHKLWRRAKSVLGYIEGTSARELARQVHVDRSAVAKWIAWYNARGLSGLRFRKPPGRPRRLGTAERAELASVVEAGPQAAGYASGVWTGPRIGAWVEERFSIRYHVNYVPRLLHQLGFSVQRPRKRLAKADLAAQETWLKKRFPKIKKRQPHAEASCSSKTRRVSGSTVRFIGHGVA